MGEDFARNLLSWKHSEFSIGNSVRILDESSQQIPPERLQLIRRYGLYASRTKGRSGAMPSVAERTPQGWKASHSTASTAEDRRYESVAASEVEVDIDARKRACDEPSS